MSIDYFNDNLKTHINKTIENISEIRRANEFSFDEAIKVYELAIQAQRSDILDEALNRIADTNGGIELDALCDKISDETWNIRRDFEEENIKWRDLFRVINKL